MTKIRLAIKIWRMLVRLEVDHDTLALLAKSKRLKIVLMEDDNYDD